MRPALGDVLLAAVLTAVTLSALVTDDDAGWTAYVIATLTAAPVAVRQRMPVVTLSVIAVALAAYGLVGHGDFPNGGVGLLVAMFTVATLRPRPVAAAMWLVTTATMALTVVVLANMAHEPEIVLPTLGQTAMVTVGAWMLGETTRKWGERTRRLAEEAAKAVANERVRIARELHDVVAHHMSVISLQAGLAKYVLDTDLPTARTAIATVGETSREAVTELRRLLDVLRIDPSADSDYRPQPGLALLDELVNRTRAAGLPVELAVTGDPRPLPPGKDLCAYRIAQESLTNVLKHAGPATARVEVDHGERMLTLRITDNGTRTNGETPGSPSSHGIRGMRERAELYGGVLDAGPVKEGGFRVTLRLPTEDQS
jgi:signal transduction histidine kinase